MKEEGESIIKYVLSKTNLIIHSKPCKAIQHNAKNKQEKGQSLATFNPNKKKYNA
jgi:(p)ppGpp synthase/HD superfamily hydrolase